MRRSSAARWAHVLAAVVLAPGLLSLAGCTAFDRIGQPPPTVRAQQYLQEAQQHQLRGNPEAALRAFEAALRENPRLVDAHLGVGEILRQRGDFERASRAYETASALAPTSFDAHYLLGFTRQLSGRVDEAVGAYLQALAIRPESLEANQNLASAYLQLNRPGDALPYAIRAAELGPRSQPAWANLGAAYSLLGYHEQAVLAYRQAADLSPGVVSEPIAMGLADAHIKLNQFDRAIAVLQSQIRTAPSAVAYERLGFAQFKQRRYAEALTSFRAALQHDPDDPAALNGVGVCLMTAYIQSLQTATDLKREALDAWRHSLRLRPDQPRIIDLLSRYQRL